MPYGALYLKNLFETAARDKTAAQNEKGLRPYRLQPFSFSNGGPGKIRTCGLRIRSPALYPLSYGPAREANI